MLNENIKVIRKSKGLSQEELAIKLNVVRQTVSKWEKGLSVPDADMLIAISDILETPVGTLLGETVSETPTEDVKAIAEKLEVVNLQLAKMKLAKWRALFWAAVSTAVLIVVIFIILAFINGEYLNWNFDDPEVAVAGTILHAFEFVFARVAPLAFIGAVAVSIFAKIKMSTSSF